MKPELKKIWVKALRSGEYKQTKKRLCDRNGYCCLGVAYDVLCDGDWLQPEGLKAWGIRKARVGAVEYSMIPQSILDEWGLRRDDACWLAELNDIGVSLDVIAARIEDEL